MEESVLASLESWELDVIGRMQERSCDFLFSFFLKFTT